KCDARTVLAPSSHRSESLCPRCGSTLAIEPPSGPSQASEPQKDFGSARDLTFPGPPGLDKFTHRGADSKERAFGRYELLADFGLAKDAEDDAALTLSQDRLGTPLFMAPEQVKRGSSGVDNKVDIWALGVMLFVSVTGRYPFRGRTIMSLYMKILNEEPDWY